MWNVKKKMVRVISSAVVCGTVFSMLLPVANAVAADETNLALNKGVTITSSSDYPGQDNGLAIDGNPATRWASQKTSETQKQQETLKIDLGADKVIDEIRISFENPAQEYRVKLIADSNDPKGEHTVTHPGIKQGSRVTDKIECNGVQARYIEFIGVEQARFIDDRKHYTPWGYSIYEMEVIQLTKDQDTKDLKKAISEIKLADKYYGNEVLPVTDSSKTVKFEWSSNSQNFKIDNKTGKVGVTSGSFDQNVMLTVKATKNGKELSETFPAVIGSVILSDSEYVDAAYNELTLRAHANKTFRIPLTWSTGVEEVNISWKSDSPYLVVDGDQMIVKPTTAHTKVNVTATLTKGTAQREKTFVVEITDKEVLTLGIFPEPQSTLKLGGKLNLANVAIEYKGSYDKFLTDHVNNVFKSGSNAAVKLILATEAEKDQIAKYLPEDEYSVENSIANYDGYIIKVDPQNNVVVVLGKDQSALYNAVTTLSAIMEKYNNTVDGMLIEDYANVEFRGFIEGFYGQWTQQQRISLVENLSKSKMNTYIYGSKNDAYHTKKWREPYPEKDPKAVMDMERIRQLVTATQKNNMTFVWGIHASGIKFKDPAEFDKVVAKYNQLYDAGVRQFAIFFDDGGTNFDGGAEFINRLNREYIQTKPGVKDLIYCPQGYNYKFANHREWQEIKKFDQDIQVMFTGTTTMSEINEAVMVRAEKDLGRRPYIWWNYPVNDLDMGVELVIGPLIGLDKNVSKMPGMASNPMFQAESSRVALHSIADYLWNQGAFDSFKSWEHAIETMIAEPEIREAYKLFALNVSIMVKQEFAYISQESEYLAPLMDTILKKYRNGEDCTAEVAKLKLENQKLKNAIEVLRNSKDKYSALITEMQPWLIKGIAVTDWLEDALTLIEDYTGGAYTDEQIAKIGNKHLTLKSNIDNTHGIYKEKPNLKITVDGKEQTIPNVNFGQFRFLPFIYDLAQAIEAKVTDQHVSLFGTMMINPEKVLDNDVSTVEKPYGLTGKEHKFLRPGLYFGVDLGAVKAVNGIHFVVNNLVKGDIEISTDMENWEKVGEISKEHGDVTLTDLNKKAKYVRVVVKEKQEPAIAVAELQVTATENIASAEETFLTVDKGTKFEALNLPAQVNVTLSSGKTVLCNVEWSVGAYDENTVGKYTIEGKIIGSSELGNVDQIAAHATVNVVDRSALADLYNEVKDFAADDFTVSSFGGFETARADAEAVLNKENVTQEEIEASLNALKAAVNGLLERADTKEAEKLLAEIAEKNLRKEHYTPDTWALFEEAKQNLEKAVEDNSDVSVEQMNELIKEFKNAYNGLKAAEQKPDNIPQTGDSAHLAIWMAAFALTFAGFAGVVYTRKKYGTNSNH